MAVFALSALLSLALASCGDDDSSPTDPGPSVNHAPAAPALDIAGGAPAHEATDVAHSVTLSWTCSDADGDALTYDVYFGTAADPPLSSEGQSETSIDYHSLSTTTEYFWRIVAKDPDGETTSSPTWSFTTAAAPVETVSQPSPPSGPANGSTGQNLVYTATGAVSSFSLSVQYRFDWGDGNTSPWSTGTKTQITGSHAWTNAGTYDVKVQARSTRTPAIESVWSEALGVTIEAPPETISINNRISGPANLAAGVAAEFEFVGWVESSEGHATEWRFNWGDGSYGDWTTVKKDSHAWATPGNYDIGLQGRCIEHPTATHERLDMAAVEIAESETISTPTRISGIYGSNYSQFEYWVESHATSSFGHDIELRYDFGDGTISDWIPEWTRATHTWDLGTYEVKAQARCADHPTVVSEWNAPLVANFAELLTGIGDRVSGPDAGNVGVPVEFTVGEVTSNEGHAVEYTYYYRRANTSDYIYGDYQPANILSITWDQAGTYYVSARVRCVEHPDVTTQTRLNHIIVISP
jgi:hypothetical protein